VLTIEDVETGAKRFMRTTSNYRFTAGPTGSRRFKITATKSGAGRLMIANLVAAPSRGAASISFALTRGADVEVQVQSLNGRMIRRLTTRARSDAGINTVTWDLKDNGGRRVPRGMYIVQVTARDPDGEYTRAVVPLTTSR
jgi:flagellar hook assembly protein FlgD